MNRRLVSLLILGLTAVVSVRSGAVEKEPARDKARGVVQQITKEIQELSQNRDREEALFRQQQEKIAAQKEAVAAAQAAYDRLQGADQAAVSKAAAQLEDERARLLLAISQKDHTLYRLGIVERGIRDRRARLRQSQSEATANLQTATARPTR